MKRENLIVILQALAKECDSPETMTASGILYCLIGAMYEGTEADLCILLRDYSQGRLAKLTAIEAH